MSDPIPTAIHKITVAEAIACQVFEFVPAGPASSSPPLFLLHGLTRNARDFLPLIAHMLADGHRVIALDVRGRGGSDWDPDPANYQPPVYVQDVIKVLASLGIARAVFIGTSMGGLITTLMALMAPQMVAAAVLNDIGPEIAPEGIARIKGYVGGSGGPMPDWATATAAIRAIGESAFPGKPDSFWDDFARRTCVETADGIAFAYDPAIANVFRNPEPEPAPDLWPMFAAFGAIPTASIRGALSDLFAQSTQNRMKAMKPDLITAVVPDVGHAPILDEPEALAAIREVIARAS